MAIRLGLDAKLYYGVKGSTASTVMDNVKDVTLGLTQAEADVTTRGANGWRLTVGTLKEGTVDFQMVQDTADAGFNAIKDAFFDNDAIALLVLDGTNGSGLDADFSVTSFTRNEALEDALTVDVSVKPTYSTRAPAWVEGS